MKTDNLKKFEEKIGVTFKNIDLLKTAFTHRSYLNEHKGKDLEHNERLEFLGDAVLELVVTKHLFDKFPEENEGALTSYRSAIVNTVSLMRVADELEINDLVLLSKGEAQDQGRARNYILANIIEAIIGAIYLDQGYQVAGEFIAKYFLKITDEVVEKSLWKDNKSLFQEIAQEKEKVTPEYNTLKEEGPDHNKKFVVGVFLRDKLIAEGKGVSKQEAEQNAAENALAIKKWA